MPNLNFSCCSLKLSLLVPSTIQMQLFSSLFTAAFISGHTAQPKYKARGQNMGPNSDLSHLLKQHNYHLTHAILLIAEALSPSDHHCKSDTFGSIFYIILFWPSPSFSNTSPFFLFKRCPSNVSVSCFNILYNCLCEEWSINLHCCYR